MRQIRLWVAISIEVNEKPSTHSLTQSLFDHMDNDPLACGLGIIFGVLQLSVIDDE